VGGKKRNMDTLEVDEFDVEALSQAIPDPKQICAPTVRLHIEEPVHSDVLHTIESLAVHTEQVTVVECKPNFQPKDLGYLENYKRSISGGSRKSFWSGTTKPTKTKGLVLLLNKKNCEGNELQLTFKLRK
jgi:hypothetical protein